MATAREEIINIYDTLPARYNLGEIEEEPEPIGKGMWSVHRGRWGDRGVAVKKFDLRNTDHNFNLASKEMSRMIRLRHQNVLNVYGFYFVAEGLVLKCSMVMELMDSDLYKYIEQRQAEGSPVTDDEVVYIIAEIARGMKHVHENGYSHRDLKPQNVLMKRSAVLTSFHLDVKVADFGSSELMSGGHCNRTSGTSRYKAPEQFNRDAALRGDKMDVYSFGCLCFKLWTGEDPPFKNHAELMKFWEQRCARNVPDDVQDIITKCLDIDPNARPGFSKISGNLDAVLKERQLEQLPHPVELTHDEATDLVRSRNEIVEELGLDGGVDGLDYADYVIPSEELDLCGILGMGSEARVYEVNWKGTRCALKVFENSSDYLMDGEPSRFKMLPTLIHDNVVRFLGYSLTTFVEGDWMRPSILMEYLASNLSLLISRRHCSVSFPKHRSWKIMKGIAEGMKFMHGRDWVHGDLKPANVMVNIPDEDVAADDIVVKLIDFNLLGGDALGCTTRYAAPEVLRARHYKDLRREIDYKKADVYSFAITCSDIIGTMETLYPEQKFIKNVIDGVRPDWNWGIARCWETRDVFNLIEICWRPDPTKRPSFCDICEFFSRPMPVRHREPMPVQHREPTRDQCNLL